MTITGTSRGRGRGRSSYSPFVDAFGSLSLGSSTGGRGRGGGGGYESSFQRHNVNRLPELDYFCRKVNQEEDPPHWDLPYAKAGAAGALPDSFATVGAYLDAMQSMAAIEFQAAIKSALELADREERRTGTSGFHTFQSRKIQNGASSGTCAGTWIYAGLGSLDFDTDSWGRHLVEVKDTGSFHVALVAKPDEETGEQVLVVLPTVEMDSEPVEGMHLTCRIRSLGYIGPFLSQYESAQLLRYQHKMGHLPAATKALLSVVTDPSSWRHNALQCRTLVLARPLQTDKVPINEYQHRAVRGLRGGLDIIHGPPGTGKSTTVFHIIDSRVQEDKQVLVTCTRNQAIDSIADKVSLLDGGILVFGNAARLGESAAQHTLKARVEAHPDVVSWVESLAELQELEAGLDSMERRRASPERLRREVLPVLETAIERSEDAVEFECHAEEDALRVLANSISQKTYIHDHVDGIRWDDMLSWVQSAVRHVQSALNSLRDAVKRKILGETRVFVCTIDATARMVVELAELQVTLNLDTVLVDEAGCVPECAIPMLLRLRPSNLVLIGDHKQLQAFTSLVDPPRNHSRSLMERAADAGVPAAMLAEQYRMHPDICAAVSDTFYHGKLLSAAIMHRTRPCSPACCLVNVNGDEEQHRGGGFSNKDAARAAIQAAEKAVDKLRQLGMAGGSKRCSMFILTLYNRQRGLILDLMEQARTASRLKSLGCDVAVLSADACQGSEADIVVLSTVRNTTASGTSGAPLSRFFNDSRRLNVALSRARHLCVIVGSKGTLTRAAYRHDMWNILASYEE